MKFRSRNRAYKLLWFVISFIVITLIYLFFVHPFIVDSLLPEDRTLKPTVIQSTFLSTNTSVDEYQNPQIALQRDIPEEESSEVSTEQNRQDQPLASSPEPVEEEASPFQRGDWDNNKDAYDI